MRKPVLALIALVSLAGLPARAALCTIDAVPAATLLLPYFEVNLTDPQWHTTLFSVNNASAAPALAHVVLWTDLSVPTLDFDIYLTGYDVQTINLRDIFELGVLPETASLGQDPGDTISPQGEFSGDVDFASCAGQLPFSNPVLPDFFVDHLRAAHTGHFSSVLGGCAGQDLGDNVARGYVTIDNVTECSLAFPGDAGYFGPSGVASDVNQLWGDYFYVSSLHNMASGNTLVHIEADPLAFHPGDYTFYGRYVGASAADGREPLGTTYAVRYATGGAFTGGTHVIAWRDSKIDQGPFACGTVPSWYPLAQQAIVIFDEQEHPEVAPTFPVSPPVTPGLLLPFPAETNSAAVGSDALPVPFDFGWLYLNLNTTTGGVFDPFAQSWVTVELDAEGRFSVGYDATQLDSACNPNTSDPGQP